MGAPGLHWRRQTGNASERLMDLVSSIPTAIENSPTIPMIATISPSNASMDRTGSAEKILQGKSKHGQGFSHNFLIATQHACEESRSVLVADLGSKKSDRGRDNHC